MLEVHRGDVIEKAIREATGTALCAYLMAGYPSLAEFPELLGEVSRVADLVEVGVPFSDPMADGQTIQHAGHVALQNGATLDWIFDLLAEIGDGLGTPHLLMGYYNPFLAHGFDRLTARLRDVATAGLIVPDLPLEESESLESALAPDRIALIRLVTPATPENRLRRIGSTARGFVYAVTTTGITGGDLRVPPELVDYLDRLRASTDRPILAGFGVRRRDQVDTLARHVDGVIVGTALIDAVDRGENPAELLSELRPSLTSAGRNAHMWEPKP